MPAQYTVSHDGKQFGPHSEEEVASMFHAGMVDDSALLWAEGWPAWRPIQKVLLATGSPATVAVETAEQPAQVVSYQPKQTHNRHRTKGYRDSVGRRSFIFQIVLAIWTISYVGWLLCMLAESTSTPAPGSVGGPGTSYFSSRSVQSSPLDFYTGVFSGWMCLGLGWCIIGLPVGIAAVATLRDDDR
jgi:hypothetical protein